MTNDSEAQDEKLRLEEEARRQEQLLLQDDSHISDVVSYSHGWLAKVEPKKKLIINKLITIKNFNLQDNISCKK